MFKSFPEDLARGERGKIVSGGEGAKTQGVGNTYPLGGAKNFTMLQEVRIDPIRTPWEKLKIFTMLQ